MRDIAFRYEPRPRIHRGRGSPITSFLTTLQSWHHPYGGGGRGGIFTEHFCTGAPLERLPDLRLAIPEDEVEWEFFIPFRRLSALPVTWG